MRGSRLILTAFFCMTVVNANAQQQPVGAPNPAQMAGLLRADSSVASGTVMVRVVQTDFSHRLKDVVVDLLSEGVNVQTQKTSGEGLVTFTNVKPGIVYVVKAQLNGNVETSEPVILPETSGGRMLLVFKKDVTSSRAAVEVPIGSHSSIAPSFTHGAVETQSKNNLVLADGSYIKILPDYESQIESRIRVEQELLVKNTTQSPLVGPLTILLPVDAKNISYSALGQKESLSQNPVIVQGPFPPGISEVVIWFTMPRNSSLEFVQQLPLATEGLVIVTPYKTRIKVQQVNVVPKHVPSHQGLMVFRLPPLPAQLSLSVQADGILHRWYVAEWIALGAALCILLSFFIVTVRSSRSSRAGVHS